MPRGDGTGPMGLGPMTGRAVGYCNGYENPGFADSVLGFGRGGGRGLRRRSSVCGFPRTVPIMQEYPAYYQANRVNPEVELQMLNNQIKMMERSLKNAKERLSELEKAED